MANPITYLSTDYQTLTNGVVTGTEKVFFTYDGDALSCSQAEAGFSGLTESQTVARRQACQVAAPATPAGQTLSLRNCGAGFDITVTAEESDWVADTGTITPPTTPPTADTSTNGTLGGYYEV